MTDLVQRLRNHGDIIANEAADRIEELEAMLVIKLVKNHDSKLNRNHCIVQLWNSGMKYRYIAEQLGITYDIVHRVVDEARRRGEAINVWDRHNLTDD